MPQGKIKVGDIVERTSYSRYAMHTYNQEGRALRFGPIGVPMTVSDTSIAGNIMLDGYTGYHSSAFFIIKKRKYHNFNVTFIRNELNPLGDYIIHTERFANLAAAQVFIRDFPRDFPGYTIVATKRVSYYINIPRG